jgi:hypothetical protein
LNPGKPLVRVSVDFEPTRLLFIFGRVASTPDKSIRLMSHESFKHGTDAGRR